MKNDSLKNTSLADIQATFSKALSELVGFECSVVLDELRFETGGANAWMGREVAAISGHIEKARNYSEGFGNEA